MRFAVFYNRQDLAPIVAELTRADLAGTDKQLAQKLWNAGFKNWNTAPVWTGPQAGGDPDCRIIVIDETGIGVADLIGLLRRLATSGGAEYLNAIADDMGCFASPNCSGALEPWTQ